MVFAILVTLAVCTLAVVVLRTFSTHLCARLGLHPQSVLQWFGFVPAPSRRR